MATALGEVVRHVQNPALGSVLQWRFVVGYSDASNPARGCPLPLIFLLLPVIFHEASLEHLQSTRRSSGLRAFIAKFGSTNNKEADLLLGIHDRAERLKELSLESVRVACASRLLAVDLVTGVVHAVSTTRPRRGIPKSVERLMKESEKFGAWCAEITFHEIASALKVRF